MPMITVVKPFLLQLDPVKRKVTDPMDSQKEVEETLPAEFRHFDIGVFEVDERIAGHWYVQPHLKGYVEPPKGPGTAEFQIAQQMAARPTGAPGEPPDPYKGMPPDASPPRPAALPPGTTRAEPIA